VKQKDKLHPNMFADEKSGHLGMRSRNGGPAFTWHRDIAVIMEDLLRNAAVLTEMQIKARVRKTTLATVFGWWRMHAWAFAGLFSRRQPEQTMTAPTAEQLELLILDTILQYCVRVWVGCRTGKPNISAFNEMLQYLRDREEAGSRVFGTFTSMFFISVFAFLFGSKTIAIQAPREMNLDASTYAMILTALSGMPDADRRQMIGMITKALVLPPGFYVGDMLRQAESYLTEIQKHQNQLPKQSAEQVSKQTQQKG